MSNLVLYTTDDDKSQFQLWTDLGTVWLTQLEMAKLFDAKQNILLHLKSLFEDESLTVRTEGTRKVQRPIVQPCPHGAKPGAAVSGL